MSIKRGKTIKGKHIGHKNNYKDNLLDKQWLNQVKIVGEGYEKGL